MDNPEVIGARLKTLRKALGFEQARSFAKFLDLNEQAWNHFERGRRPPVVQDGIRIAEKTGVSLDWIYRGLEHTHPVHIAEKLRLKAAADRAADRDWLDLTQRRKGSDVTWTGPR